MSCVIGSFNARLSIVSFDAHLYYINAFIEYRTPPPTTTSFVQLAEEQAANEAANKASAEWHRSLTHGLAGCSSMIRPVWQAAPSKNLTGPPSEGDATRGSIPRGPARLCHHRPQHAPRPWHSRRG